jgi:hypothetical protein
MGLGASARRLTTETKSSFKTSEFWTYLLVLIAILIAGNAIEREEGGPDIFAADKIWLYVTILTVGYMISRGIAKAGVRDPYWEGPERDSGDGAPITERVKAAAQVLTEGPDAAGTDQADQHRPQPPRTGRRPGAGV